jgi:hypothetical protein
MSIVGGFVHSLDYFFSLYFYLFISRYDATTNIYREGLNENGVIVLKENVTSSGEVEVDDVDGSVTRPAELVKDIIKRAELTIIEERRQTKFPRSLYPVYMYACRPAIP